jgi:hypothetical protein
MSPVAGAPWRSGGISSLSYSTRITLLACPSDARRTRSENSDGTALPADDLLISSIGAATKMRPFSTNPGTAIVSSVANVFLPLASISTIYPAFVSGGLVGASSMR